MQLSNEMLQSIPLPMTELHAQTCRYFEVPRHTWNANGYFV